MDRRKEYLIIIGLVCMFFGAGLFGINFARALQGVTWMWWLIPFNLLTIIFGGMIIRQASSWPKD